MFSWHFIQIVLKTKYLARILVFFWKPSLDLIDMQSAHPRGALIPGHCSSSPSPISPTNLTVRYSRSRTPPALWTPPSPFTCLIKHDKEDQCCWSHDNRLDDDSQWDRQHLNGSKLWQHFFLFNHWGWGLQLSLTAKGETRAGCPSVSHSHSGCLQYTDVYWMRSWPYNVKRCKTTK